IRSGAAGASADGTRNWWGSASGPTNGGNPGGTGTTLAGNVTFNPWLCSGTDTSVSPGFQPNLTLCPTPTPTPTETPTPSPSPTPTETPTPTPSPTPTETPTPSPSPSPSPTPTPTP